jgi:hypothetical protein
MRINAVGMEPSVIGGQGAGLTRIVYAWLTWQPFASVAVIVTIDVPGFVGLPQRRPAGTSVRPGGSEPSVTA